MSYFLAFNSCDLQIILTWFINYVEVLWLADTSTKTKVGYPCNCMDLEMNSWFFFFAKHCTCSPNLKITRQSTLFVMSIDHLLNSSVAGVQQVAAFVKIIKDFQFINNYNQRRTETVWRARAVRGIGGFFFLLL